MLFQKMRRLRSEPANSNGSEDIVVECFSATIDYLPNVPLPQTKITASFHQFVKLQSATTLNPTLEFCAIIPDNAPIFELIRANDVIGVERLLNEGLASLSDCDLKGRSLLYV